jgi:hypothetical protein
MTRINGAGSTIADVACVWAGAVFLSAAAFHDPSLDALSTGGIDRSDYLPSVSFFCQTADGPTQDGSERTHPE